MNRAFAALACCAVLLVPEALAESAKLSFDGLGPARFGMSRAALEAALGSRLTRDDAADSPERCEQVQRLGGDDSVAYMFVDGLLARIDIDTDQVFTVSGIGLGSTEAAVKAAYGDRVATTPHAYTGPEGKYLTLHSRDGSRGMRFETSGGHVSRYYAGTARAIEYIEGCL